MAARVVQASERKIRLRDVDQEESMGIARREAMGRGIRLKTAASDILKFGRECRLSLVL